YATGKGDYNFFAAGTGTTAFTMWQNQFQTGVYGFGIDTGVKGESTSGTGVEAASTNSYGVYATTSSTNSAAIYGVNSGGFYGVHGNSSGPRAAVYGVNV